MSGRGPCFDARRQWAYRCADCGHGRNLYAYVLSNAYGPLDFDGSLIRHDDVIECVLHEDSIDCVVHPAAIIEKRVGSRFCRWRRCERCEGHGRLYRGSRYEQRCDDCEGEGGAWEAPVWAAATLPQPEESA